MIDDRRRVNYVSADWCRLQYIHQRAVSVGESSLHRKTAVDVLLIDSAMPDEE